MPERDPCDADFERLRELFKEKGFFQTDYGWYGRKFLFPLSLWLTTWFFLTQFDNV